MDNADLGKLKISPGKLVPKFKASITDYSAVLASTVAEVKLSPLTSDSGASYTIKGAVEKVVKLTEGQTVTVEITVTAEDGKSTKTYTLLIRRLSPDDASLNSLELSAGVLQPAFSPLVTQYDCYLPSSVDSLSIRAKTEDEAMKLGMRDGSPLGTVQLTPGRTLVEISVGSVNGKSSTIYSVVVIKNRLPTTVQLKSPDSSFECGVCCGVVACPSKIQGGPYVYCQSCLEELTRTNKSDPFTGQVFEPEEKWFINDLEVDKKLSGQVATCGVVEATLGQLGPKLLAERLKIAQTEEASQACPDCSKKVPTETMSLHKDKLCSAKHTHTVTKQEVKMKSWERSLINESLGTDAKKLLQSAAGLEKDYLQSLPKPGKTVIYPDGKAPLDYLHKAAQCYASILKGSPKNAPAHLGLGFIMEEFFYAEDLYGLKRESPGSAEEGEAKTSSKEEEFLAICQLHGVSGSAPVAVQLKAVEAEYHSLKEAGQAHKAEHVQGLHAWKSKKILQASQGSYTVDSESPLYQAKLKYTDAVSSDPNDAIALYHLGRLCLLLGEPATEHLVASLSIKPTLSEARYCLGLDSKNRTLLTTGLRHYQRAVQEVNESQANPMRGEPRELHSRTLYRPSNTLIVDGFMCLSSLGGSANLSHSQCLLSVTPVIAVASLQHRGSTYQKLLWSTLMARSHLLKLYHKNKDIGTLTHCRQLSGLIGCCGLPPSPQLRELQMEVFQLGVVLQPSSSEALYHLGNGQLAQYEATSDASCLNDAEQSYRASIAMEGKRISPSLVPEQLKKEQWCIKQTITDNKATASKNSTTTGKPAAAAPAKPGPATQSKAPVSKAPPGKAPAATKAPVRGAPAKKPTPAQSRGAPAKSTPVKTTAKTQPAAKTTPQAKAAPSQTAKAPTVAKTEPPKPAEVVKVPEETKGEMNKKSFHPRLGLARTLAKNTDTANHKEAHSLYKEVITMAPLVHDAYIELGEMLAKSNPQEAVDVYCRYPFNDPPTFDDAYLHGEIVRLLMSTENYDDPRLCSSMIAQGKALGIGVLEKQVSVLENKFKSALCKKIYAGVHGKSVDNPDLQAFFKFKCWL